MRNLMKTFILTAWVLLIWAGNTIGELISKVNLADWSQLGWAFGGSTAFVLWEFIEDKRRDGWKRGALIALGMLVAMAGSDQATKTTGLDPALVTAALGAIGYKLFGLFQKKADKAEKVSDITDLKID